MPKYETTMLVRQDASTPEVEKLIQQFSDIITGNGGKVVNVENWGSRVLAYPIKNNRKATYALLNIDGPSDAVKEMERQMSHNDNILRTLTIRVEAFQEGGSPMIRGEDRSVSRRSAAEEDAA